jgi:hypothetical protein
MGKATENDNGMIYAYYTHYDLTNRSRKRAVYHEARKLMAEIGEIEVEFLTNLFTEQFEYKHLYEKLKNDYLRMITTHKWKHIIPNMLYIELKYKPIA